MTLRNIVSMFAFSMLTMAAIVGVSFAQTSTSTTATSTASLGVTLSATSQVAPGTNDALMALAILTSGSNSVQISALPISATFNNGLSANHISDCRVRNVMTLATSLNSVATGLSSGSNPLTFSSPLTIPAHSTVTLAVTCDVASDAPASGVVALALIPSALPATLSGSNATITPITGQSPNGGTGVTVGTVTITPNAPIPTIPGVPNTGVGDSSLLVLALAVLFGLGAAFVLSRRTV